MSNRKTVADATDAELRAYAETILGLTVHHNAKRETILAKIAEVQENLTEIPVLEGSVATPPIAPEPPAPVTEAKRPATKIIKIQITQDFDGEEPVPVGVNGRVMVIPRGKWCEIPIGYYDVLTHAIEDQWDMRRNERDEMVMAETPRKVARYPFETWTGAGDPPEGVLRPSAIAPSTQVAAA